MAKGYLAKKLTSINNERCEKKQFEQKINKMTINCTSQTKPKILYFEGHKTYVN